MSWYWRTTDEKIHQLLCTIASEKKELEVLWKLETTGGYLIGKRDEILVLEKSLAYKKEKLKLLKEVK